MNANELLLVDDKYIDAYQTALAQGVSEVRALNTVIKAMLKSIERKTNEGKK